MKIYYKILTGALIAIVPVLTQSQNISTFAGTGLSGYFGDGGQATDAELSSPGGLYMDKTGNVLIADQGNGSIRQVSASGIVTTIVGVGAGGYYGDGGQATAAELSAPELLWVDTSSGNLFIADQLNNRIRKVDNSGIITTVAGIGVSGYSGDGGQATDAELATPIAVSFDNSGNMYIADYSTHHIRKVDNSGVITTIAGTGIGGYNGDGIQATAAELNNPSSVRVDAAGNIYVSEINGQRIRKIDPSGIISTIAGTGAGGYNGDGISATSAQISDPFDVFLDASGDVFIAEFIGNRVREVNTSGMISTIAGIGVGGFSGDGGLATAAELNYPLAIYVDASANMYIAEWGRRSLRCSSWRTLDGSRSPASLSSSWTSWPEGVCGSGSTTPWPC